jgi:hypothetical protein
VCAIRDDATGCSGSIHSAAAGSAGVNAGLISVIFDHSGIPGTIWRKDNRELPEFLEKGK